MTVTRYDELLLLFDERFNTPATSRSYADCGRLDSTILATIDDLPQTSYINWYSAPIIPVAMKPSNTSTLEICVGVKRQGKSDEQGGND
jgi:hypothetical protein